MQFNGLKLAKRFILPYLPPMTTCLKFLTPLTIKRDEIAVEIQERQEER